MSEETRDVLDGLEGYTPGPWRDGGGRDHLSGINGERVIFSGWTGGLGSSSQWPDGLANSQLAKRSPELVEEIRRLRAVLSECAKQLAVMGGADGHVRMARALLPPTGDSDGR